MKFSASAIISAAFLVAASDAFSPMASPSAMRAATALSAATRPDTSAMIQEALRLSKEHGASSPEARLAWEAVEEVDAADNSVATEPPADVECEVGEEGDAVSAWCEEYNEKISALEAVMKKQQPSLDAIKAMAEELRSVKLTSPEMKAGPPTVGLEAAIAEAKKATVDFGMQSTEARLAWEAVEEIASASRTDNMTGGMITEDECLVDAAMEACQALEEFNRVLNLNKEKLNEA
mmetsp:Transcript_1691/g.4150  ORF Transcript_1691/g.4150 Transcript_1691/m.4150 type:complete len:235 (+) Transcript_1691:145-849(+)